MKREEEFMRKLSPEEQGEVKILDAMIEESKSIIQKHERAIDDAKIRKAGMLSIFKPGDIVEWGRRMKFRGEVMYPYFGYAGLMWEVRRILKGSKPGKKSSARISIWDDPVLINEKTKEKGL